MNYLGLYRIYSHVHRLRIYVCGPKSGCPHRVDVAQEPTLPDQPMEQLDDHVSNQYEIVQLSPPFAQDSSSSMGNSKRATF